MIMRAEEECLSFSQIDGLLSRLRRHCDALDCDGISRVLNSAVSGCGGHVMRYDHLWNRQAKLAVAESAAVSNVKELFPDKP